MIYLQASNSANKDKLDLYLKLLTDLGSTGGHAMQKIERKVFEAIKQAEGPMARLWLQR